MTYFEWLCNKIWSPVIDICNYDRLLSFLYDTEFKWKNARDSNRAHDGISMRKEYKYEGNVDRSVSLERPCSVLEMMVALACRCERDIMDDPDLGDRTHIWFWSMVQNMGLLDMTNRDFDIDFVAERVEKVQSGSENYDYFVVDSTRKKDKNAEIWRKMIHWLNRNFDF